MAAQHRVRRWLVRLSLGFVLIIAVSAGTVFGWSEWRLDSRTHVPRHAFTVPPATPALLALGRHQSIIHGCSDCHGENLGGRVFLENFPIGRIVAWNLTRGATGPELTDEQWERAVRHGVGRDDRSLKIMPSHEYQHISDEEVASMAAYARSLPPVVKSLPRDAVGPIARVLLLTGTIPLLPAQRMTHLTQHVARVEAEPTVAYGQYLAPSCSGCHGATFSGGPIPGMPPGSVKPSNITPHAETGIADWTEGDFIRAMRVGLRPDSSDIDTLAMPIVATREMTDTELRALYRFLRTVPAKRYGQR